MEMTTGGSMEAASAAGSDRTEFARIGSIAVAVWTTAATIDVAKSSPALPPLAEGSVLDIASIAADVSPHESPQETVY
jgi:hypothetical protein